MFKIIKGEVRKRGEGRPIFSFNFMVLVVFFLATADTRA